jgi:hypothetical protein
MFLVLLLIACALLLLLIAAMLTDYTLTTADIQPPTGVGTLDGLSVVAVATVSRGVSREENRFWAVDAGSHRLCS